MHRNQCLVGYCAKTIGKRPPVTDTPGLIHPALCDNQIGCGSLPLLFLQKAGSTLKL